MRIKSLLICLFLYCNFYQSQSLEKIKEIDKLIDLADQNINVDFEKTLSFSQKALVAARKENDSERIAKANYYAARSLVFFRKFEESNKYLDEGLKLSILNNDVILQSLFLSLKGSYYSRMSLLEQSFESQKKALKLIESNNDLESQLLKANLYINFSDHYTDNIDFKSAHLFADKSINAIEKISTQQYHTTKKIYREKPFIYFYKSWIFLQEKQPLKAKFFIQKAFENALSEKIGYMAPFYEIYGDYHFQTKNFKKAIEFYLKTVENKQKFRQHHAYVDSKIASSYKELKDDENMILYTERAGKRFEIDRQEDLKFVRKEMTNTLHKEKRDKVNLQKKNYVFILVTISVSLLLLLFVIRRNQRIRFRKRKIIADQALKISEKNFAIKQKEEEIEKLHQKVSGSISELIEMVRKNSPHFWTEFQNIHPDFSQKMLKINPNLKSSELCFFAYIFLGFSNKEIAEYTFKALKTIENNRSNLRKRISLSSDEDFTVWIRNYLTKS